jgi:hypothetical protein
MSSVSNVIELPVRHDYDERVSLEYDIVLALATADRLSSGIGQVVERIRRDSGAGRVEWWAAADDGVVPVGGSSQRCVAAFDLDAHRRGDEGVQHQRLEDVAAQVGVVPLVASQQLDLELVADVLTPQTRSAAFFASRFSRRLPAVPRSVTAPSSNIRLREQLVGDIGHQFLVRRDSRLSVVARSQPAVDRAGL